MLSIVEVREHMCFVRTGKVNQSDQHGLLGPGSLRGAPRTGSAVAVDSRSRERSEAGWSSQETVFASSFVLHVVLCD